MTDEHRSVRLQSCGVGVTVGTYALGFGALAVANGFSVLQAVALSVLVFTGASQFALVGVVGAGGSAASGALASLAVGSRNAFYGLRLAPLLGVRGWRRLLAAQLTIDESTAVAISQRNQQLARTGFWTTGAAVFVCWNIATVTGALAVDQISDPKVIGLDAAVGAAFIALLWPQLTTATTRAVAAGAAALALVLTPLLPPGLPVLAAAVVALVIAWPEPRCPPEQPTSPDGPDE
ncbi:MAG: AzlC family ABC transporter permease [Actinomycetia bacterium]|nr:AzlC family ABC transporter permease [Actinomycetes bacterium]